MWSIKPLMFTCLFVLSVTAAQADEPPVEQRLVDTFSELAGGPHPGYRVNHAKGIVVQGFFDPDQQARQVSYAPHLQDARSEVIVRFSNATGVPDINDASPGAFPKGMAIRFLLADEEYTDIVVLSVDRFPVSTPEQFLALLTAIKNSKNSSATPSPIEQFLAQTPAAKTFVELEKPAPVGFATQSYHGINAFKFENAEGKQQFGRYLIEPVGGSEFLTEEQRQAAGEDYLKQQLSQQLQQGPVKLTISVQLAEAGDNVTDPTQVWPAERRLVKLGTLTIDSVMADGEAYAKANMFNPLAVPEGISPSDDPVLLARPVAYAISYGRRQ